MLITALVFAAQLSGGSDTSMLHYVPAEDVGQMPCPIAATPPEHPERLPNSWLFGDLRIRSEKGLTNCWFQQLEAGRCGFGDPGFLVVAFHGETVIYDIPDDSSVDFEFRDKRFACRIGRRIRTHGDTIVPLLPSSH